MTDPSNSNDGEGLADAVLEREEEVIAFEMESPPSAVSEMNKTPADDSSAQKQGSAENDSPAALIETTEQHQAMGAQQGEMPFAVVDGKPVTQLPKDLYIPPSALQVFLEAFEGPLDLLLYLIKRQNIDILEINVARITEQYMKYVELMDSMQFELAAEYLVMAAMLAEIKSRMLLPRTQEEDEDEEDPRAQLIRRLQQYERFKRAAEDMDELPRQGRDTYQGSATPPEIDDEKPHPDVEMKELLLALGEVLRRADMYESHHIQKEKLSTRERMSQVLSQLSNGQFMPFVALFTIEEGRMGVVVTFLAVMELIKESLVEIVQTDMFGPIHVKARAS